MQRLETVELVKILSAEVRKLQTIAEAAAGQSERAQELHGEISRQESRLASKMEGVGALFSLLSTALQDERFVTHPEAAVEAQVALENEIFGYGDDDSGDKKKGRLSRRKRGINGGGQESTAARVRATAHRDRTSDEKMWVALDAVVNPRLYHHVTLAEAEEMRWDALYYTRLDREDILRVLSLPAQVQLALPFLHTPHELAAHELLTRFSLGMNADHFARLDKNSQDECRRRKKIYTAPCSSSSASSASSSSSATAGLGGNGSAGGSATTGRGPSSSGGWDDDNVAGATRRVLVCMRHAAEAYLKLPDERDNDEAVWCVLDQKLRSDLYRDSDEAAADRSEELFREADAREDARHTWLTTPEDGGNTREIATKAERPSSEYNRGIQMGSVVKQKREADQEAAAKNIMEDREALLVGITDFFSEDDVKSLAAAAAGESVRAGKLGPGPKIAVCREGATREEGGRQGVTTSSSAGTNDGAEPLTLATPTAAVAGKEITNDADEAPRRENGDDGGETWVKEEHKREKEEAGWKQRRRLVEVAESVLPRFLVAEEETPLGRDMTRSLAMLQEVALRLGREQRNLFSGLNPQSALAFLRSHPSSSRIQSSTAAAGCSAPAAAAAPTAIPAAASTVAEGDSGGGGGGAEVVLRDSVEIAYRGQNQEGILIEAAAADQAITNSTAETRSQVPGERMSSSVDDKLDAKTQPSTGETKSTSTSTSGSGSGSWDNNNGGNGDGKNAINRGGGSTASTSTTRKNLEKVYGSWEEVHPAALGFSSQKDQFLPGERGGAHPASFQSPRATGAQKHRRESES